MKKPPVMESFLISLFEWTSRPVTSLKKSLHQGCLPVNRLELSGLQQKGLAWV